MARAFGTGHACATKCEKCEVGKAYIRTTLKEFEDVSAVSNRTEREDMVVSQDSYSLFSTRTSRHCIYARCLIFRFRDRLLALSSSLPSQFLPF